MTRNRRALQFDSLADVMADVDRLALGHHAHGQWTLGQVCRHLAVAIAGTLRNRPREVTRELAPEQAAARQRILKEGRFEEGVPIPFERLVPPPDVDDQAEVAALRDALVQYQNTPGEFGPHPLLGPLTRAEWDRFHAVHCAHHLSFLEARA